MMTHPCHNNCELNRCLFDANIAHGTVHCQMKTDRVYNHLSGHEKGLFCICSALSLGRVPTFSVAVDPLDLC